MNELDSKISELERVASFDNSMQTKQELLASKYEFEFDDLKVFYFYFLSK